jgi:hypothetical protein
MPVRLTLPTFPVSVSSGQWIDLFTFLDEDGIWITATGAAKAWRRTVAKRHAFETRLDGARKKPVRLLGGKTIRHKYITPPTPRRAAEVCVYFKPDVKALAEGGLCAPDDRWKDEAGRAWVTEKQLCDTCGVAPYSFVKYWCGRKSRLRPGEWALRARQIPNLTHSRGRAVVRGLLEEYIRAILRGDETAPASYNRGRRANALPGRPTFRPAGSRLKAAKAHIKKALAGGPALRREVVALAKQAGIGEVFLRRAAEALGVAWDRRTGRGGEGYWYLPGQEPPANTSIYGGIATLLRSILADGPLPAKEVVKQARQAGVPHVRLYIAKKRLGIIRTERAGRTILWHLAGRPSANGASNRERSIMREAAQDNGDVPQPAADQALSDLAASPTRETEKEKAARLNADEIAKRTLHVVMVGDHRTAAACPGRRLEFDNLSLTVRIDGGRSIQVSNPRAYGGFRVIADANPNVVNRPHIQSAVRGTRGDRTIPNLIAELPPALRAAVQSNNTGYWLCLPPQKKSTQGG